MLPALFILNVVTARAIKNEVSDTSANASYCSVFERGGGRIDCDTGVAGSHLYIYIYTESHPKKCKDPKPLDCSVFSVCT